MESTTSDFFTLKPSGEQEIEIDTTGIVQMRFVPGSAEEVWILFSDGRIASRNITSDKKSERTVFRLRPEKGVARPLCFDFFGNVKKERKVVIAYVVQTEAHHMYNLDIHELSVDNPESKEVKKLINFECTSSVSGSFVAYCGVDESVLLYPGNKDEKYNVSQLMPNLYGNLLKIVPSELEHFINSATRTQIDIFGFFQDDCIVKEDISPPSYIISDEANDRFFIFEKNAAHCLVRPKHDYDNYVEKLVFSKSEDFICPILFDAGILILCKTGVVKFIKERTFEFIDVGSIEKGFMLGCGQKVFLVRMEKKKIGFSELVARIGEKFDARPFLEKHEEESEDEELEEEEEEEEEENEKKEVLTPVKEEIPSPKEEKSIVIKKVEPKVVPSVPSPPSKENTMFMKKFADFENSLLFVPRDFVAKKEEKLSEESVRLLFSAFLVNQNKVVSQIRSSFLSPVSPRMTFVVINGDGNVYIQSTPGAYPASQEEAYYKAYLSYSHSSSDAGCTSAQVLSGNGDFRISFKEGGYPIYENGKLCGAVGVAGDSDDIMKKISLVCISFIGAKTDCREEQRNLDVKKIHNFRKAKDLAIGETEVNSKKIYVIYYHQTTQRYCKHEYSSLSDLKEKIKRTKSVCPECSDMEIK